MKRLVGSLVLSKNGYKSGYILKPSYRVLLWLAGDSRSEANRPATFPGLLLSLSYSFMYAPTTYLTLLCLLLTGCVDPYPVEVHSSLTVLVVDGTITNLAEPQVIRLNRSSSDPVTGFPSSVPLTKATVEIVVDSAQIVAAHETSAGSYQLPSDFKGKVGHAYQLRFTLSDGAYYQSTHQVMPAVPPITALRAEFNPNSLPANQLNGYTAAHDVYLDTQDPASQHNYYRWDWKLWEKQDWCRTCIQGQYSINNVLILTSANGIRYLATGDSLFEGCVYAPPRENYQVSLPYWVYDYPCRTECWAIFHSYRLNIFSDEYSNGGVIAARKVAQIPFYQHGPCLVEIRQAALTPSAYRFYKQLQDQTQNNGGIADTPPSVSVGNVQRLSNEREIVVGVFTAAAVATARYWLDRKDTAGTPPGLFEALNGREPIREPALPMAPPLSILNNTTQQPPYSAVCAPGDGQTPVKPTGWRD